MPGDDAALDQPAPDGPPAPRRRRRAVGPPGSTPARGGELRALAEPPADLDADRDEQLRRDIPPHHGG